MISRARHPVRIALCLLVLLSAAGCATTQAVDPRDPLEGMNRSIYGFNEFMDQHLFDPVGQAYKTVVPGPVNRGITNMFDNVNDISVVVNDFLQFNIGQAVSDIARLVFNSVLGIAGFFDVSSHIGLPKHHEDFGQTLAHWGFGPGPYLVAPFFGPTTVRDAVGFAVDTQFLNPVSFIGNDAYRAGLLSLNYVDFKADLLSAKNIIEEAALDKYEFVKNAYLDRRERQIHGEGAGPGEGPGAD